MAEHEHGKEGSPLRSILIVGFSSAWLAVLVAGWVFPRSGGGSVAEWIEGIRWTTGTWQRWDMFKTIPNLRRYEVELVGETQAGESRTFGPVLPRLDRFESREAARHHYALNRILDQQDDFFDGYIIQATRALQQTDPEVEQFTVRIVAESTRTLARSREDGELWKSAPRTLGPFPVEDDGGR